MSLLCLLDDTLFPVQIIYSRTECCVFSRYIYTDSFAGVSVSNMIDVLAASKKYLMAKLTRYCYGFIQNHITAENSVSVWNQVQFFVWSVPYWWCVPFIRRAVFVSGRGCFRWRGGRAVCCWNQTKHDQSCVVQRLLEYNTGSTSRANQLANVDHLRIWVIPSS